MTATSFDTPAIRIWGNCYALVATGRGMAEARTELAAGNPQGWLMQPAEVTDAVLGLCQPESDSVTGQAISVSGGEVM